MNTAQFNEELKNINATSWGYGNEILYCMAKDPNDLTDKDKLSGAIWLIGRAYAASPQRRSYGTMKNTVGYINSVGKTLAECPIWPVRTQNDGREGFFDEIADEMQKLINNDAELNKLIKDYSKNPTAYLYDCSEFDIEKLIESIGIVLNYNLFLSESLEKFDEVPKGNTFNGSNVYCSNHISFASKFLHFYFPNRVFIIDNFAREGGKLLFNGNITTKLRTFYDAPTSASNIFEADVYKEFLKKKEKSIATKIIDNPIICRLGRVYDNRTRSANAVSGDNSTVKDYIEHCVRSYLLGCYITQKTEITPINQIKYGCSYVLESMPRLTDAIFLNIKAPLSAVIARHYSSIKRIYKVKYMK
ncbi:MAG: hypothetical protein J6S23_00695 [Clostridia bacterium]|nr:hypothetical protein [Clostridia bacterium]